jgi:hypothetical protein
MSADSLDFFYICLLEIQLRQTDVIEAFWGDIEAAGQDFDPRRHGRPKELSVLWIPAVSGGKAIGIAPVNEVEHDGAGVGTQGRHFPQVLLAAFRDGVGEEGEGSVDPGGVFDLDVGGGVGVAGQEEVDAAAFLAVGDLVADAIVARQFRDQVVFEGVADDAVGEGGVDAGPEGLVVVGDLDQFPGVGELALGAGGEGQEDGAADFADAGHGSSVGAVGGDDFACVEFDVGEEAFIAAEEFAGDEVGEGMDEGAAGGGFGGVEHGEVTGGRNRVGF